MNLNNIKIYVHYILPKHLLTRAVGVLAAAKMGKFTTWLIQQFIALYHVNTYEMYGNIEDYSTFNEFFSRPLKKKARPIDEKKDSVVFPVDGTISQFGNLLENIQLQAKGHYFSTDALLGSTEDAEFFKNGKFCTVYLSPTDYHRVHIPVAGKLLKMTYVPGELFSVNPLYVENIPELFSRNERVICLFETAYGKMAVILVGATIVRSISTAWAGIVAPNRFSEITSETYEKRNIAFEKGDEIGRFMMGSTVICLFEKDMITFDQILRESKHILMGTPMAQLNAAPKTAKKAVTPSKVKAIAAPKAKTAKATRTKTATTAVSKTRGRKKKSA